MERMGLVSHIERELERMLSLGQLPPDGEGYLSLKRETAVEVLAACCERASEEELKQLGDACFALRDAARWEQDSTRWAQAEFTLLRLAARVADSPGHALLLQSLERAFWGMADKVAVHLEAEIVAQWALCAMHALGERQAHGLRQELSVLLKQADEHLMNRLAPTREATVPLPPPHRPAQPAPERTWAPEPPRGEVLGEECNNLSDNQTGSSQAGAVGGSPAEPARLDSNRPEGLTLSSRGVSLGGQLEGRDSTGSPMPPALPDASEEKGLGATDGGLPPGIPRSSRVGSPECPRLTLPQRPSSLNPG
jgi:GntR family transcriptional regulator, transcriptional repressor for pyruvate dehydrogenase complex